MFRVKPIDALNSWLEGLMAEKIKLDPLLFARHQTFVTSHFFGGVCALLLVPFYLVQSAAPTIVGFMVIAWLCAPALISIYVAKSGQITKGYLLSSLSLGGLVCFIASMTGGIGSFLLPWLVVVPVEAALSGSRRVVMSALAVTCACLLGLACASFYKVLPQSVVLAQNPVFLLCIGLISAVSYVGGLAMTIQKTYERSEKELAVRERRYRLLAENATDMITRHDKNGYVRFASRAVKELLGVNAGDVIGQGLFERVHIGDRPSYLRAFAQAIELSVTANAEFRLRNKRGEFIWVEMSCRPLKSDDNGKQTSLVAITRDISAHKTLTQSLREAKQEAEKASESKSHFLANMSHELRTPLNAIIGFSEVLKGDAGKKMATGQNEEYVGIIHQSGTHLLSVVNDLLEMSKIEDGSMRIYRESFSLSETVLEVVALLSGEAEKAGVRLKAPVARHHIDFYADKRAMKQILINLVSNAIKFSNAGGRVEITAEQHSDHLLLTVSDQGIGIPRDVIPQLGKPFVQAQTDYNRSHEGTGLGLSIVKGLCELHGGQFTIESVLGEGTKVHVSMPKVEEAEGLDHEIEPAQKRA